MSLPNYLDEFMDLKHPDRVGKMQAAMSQVAQDCFEALGLDTLDQQLAYIERYGSWYDERLKEETEKADKTILQLYGLTVEDLEALEAERRRKQAGGRTANHAAKNRRTAFLSFIESERDGRSFAEAIRAAVVVCDGNPTEKTLRTWLKALVECGACDIPAPTRSKKSGTS